MLSYNDLKVGTSFLKDGEPYAVLAYEFLRMQQRRPVVKLKIKNLITGKVSEFTAHQSDTFEEAEVEVFPAKFIYSHRGEYWFSYARDPKQRFSLKEETVGEATKYLKPNLEVKALTFKDKIVGIQLPVKVELKVIEAPPALRGNTAQGGTKPVTLETGSKANVPLFVNDGDVVRINTQTGEYVERVEKG